jgi:hypothetical protein
MVRQNVGLKSLGERIFALDLDPNSFAMPLAEIKRFPGDFR